MLSPFPYPSHYSHTLPPSSNPSPPSSLSPDQASPYSILHRIHSRYPLSRHYAPLLLPAPPLLAATTLRLPPPKNTQLITLPPVHYDDPPVTHTSPRTPYDPSYDEYRSPSHVLMTDTSITHRCSPPFLTPPTSPTPYLPARTRHLRALSHQTRPLLIAYSIGSTQDIPTADITHPHFSPHLPSRPNHSHNPSPPKPNSLTSSCSALR